LENFFKTSDEKIFSSTKKKISLDEIKILLDATRHRDQWEKDN
jgi:hypothetical protein